MKKLKIFFTGLIRLLSLMIPGVAFGCYMWGVVQPLIVILAAVGIEAIWLTIFAFVLILIDAAKKIER